MRTVLFSTSRFISRLASKKQNLHLPQRHCSPILHQNNNLGVTFPPLTSHPISSGISLNATAGFATMATNTASNVQVLSSNVEKPELDDRSYRLIRLLDNKLEALLVHDPKTDKSSAAMDVHVGHLSDPKDFPGLAHALEHCLFLGTKKYPEENDYQKYLSEHSGNSNAFTDLDSTNYYFQIGHEFLEPALDRFSQFFIAPLFLADCTDRELRAVDSEHKKNLQSDTWRLFQLDKNLSNPAYPYNSFGTGNLVSLKEGPSAKGLDVRDAFINFHETYYSSNLMKLVVLGREPLDQLQEWVVSKFSAVKNKDLQAPDFEGKPYTEKELQVEVRAKPVKDRRLLEMVFTFPDQRPHYKSRPSHVLSHIIGYEGAGSLLSYLKATKHWVDSLSVGPTHINAGTELFKISMSLTKEGLAHYEEVIAIAFKYIDLLKEQSADRFKVIWEELKAMDEAHFRFAEKDQPSEFTSSTASSMQRCYPPDWVLSAPHLMREFDFDAIKHCLSFLTPDKFRVVFVAKEISENLPEKERWYGTEYSCNPLPESLVKAIENLPAIPELRMPDPNPFIPKNFAVQRREVDTPTKHPTLLRDSSVERIWFKKDDTFWVPKLYTYFLLRTPKSNDTPLHSMLTVLYIALVDDHLNEFSYDADVAGLGYSLSRDTDGLFLAAYGFNDKLHVLLSKLVHGMRNHVVKQERFNVIKDSLVRQLQNWKLNAPYDHAMNYTKYLLTSRQWTTEEKEEALKEIQAEDVQAFIPELLSNLHIETLIHGNATKDDALKLTRIVEENLGANPLDFESVEGTRSLILPTETKVTVEKTVPNPENVNSGIEYYCQVSSVTDAKKRAYLQLLSQIGREKAFDFLRTKLQLGYLIWSGIRESITTEGYRIIIQSEKPPTHLEEKIEIFLDLLRDGITEMSEGDYSSHISSLVLSLSETPKFLGKETWRYWAHIDSGFYDFKRRETDIANIKEISKEELLTFYNHYIHPSSPHRSVLSVHVKSQIEHHPIPLEDQLAQGVRLFIANEGYDIPPTEVTEAVKGDIHQIPQKVYELILKHGYNHERVAKSLAKGADMFAAQTSPIINGTVKEDGVKPQVLKEITIEDLQKFRATLKVGGRPTPVQPLETFYECESPRL